MKTSLNKQLIVGIAAGGTTLILLKGGDYKWLLLVGFAAILFVFAYVYKKWETLLRQLCYFGIVHKIE